MRHPLVMRHDRSLWTIRWKRGGLGWVARALALPAAFWVGVLAGQVSLAQSTNPVNQLTPSDLNRVMPGVPAPRFTLPDADSKPRALASFVGAPAVLVFYRGSWCPYCTNQLIELQKLIDSDLGGKAQVLAVAPEPVEKLTEMAKKVAAGAGKSSGIVFLADADHKVIDTYGLLNEGAAARGRYMPHPTTYVLDAKGIVRWKFTEVDYKIRPTNAMVLAEVKKVLGQ